MTEPNSLGATSPRSTSWFLGTGIVTLSGGVILGITTIGYGFILSALLGGSIACFALALAILWKVRGATPVYAATADPGTALPATAETGVVSPAPPIQAADAAATAAPAAALTASMNPAQGEAPIPSTGPAAESIESLTMLLDSTLGDLLQAALLKDPQRVTRLNQLLVREHPRQHAPPALAKPSQIANSPVTARTAAKA